MEEYLDTHRTRSVKVYLHNETWFLGFIAYTAAGNLVPARTINLHADEVYELYEGMRVIESVVRKNSTTAVTPLKKRRVRVEQGQNGQQQQSRKFNFADLCRNHSLDCFSFTSLDETKLSENSLLKHFCHSPIVWRWKVTDNQGETTVSTELFWFPENCLEDLDKFLNKKSMKKEHTVYQFLPVLCPNKLEEFATLKSCAVYLFWAFVKRELFPGIKEEFFLPEMYVRSEKELQEQFTSKWWKHPGIMNALPKLVEEVDKTAKCFISPVNHLCKAFWEFTDPSSFQQLLFDHLQLSRENGGTKLLTMEKNLERCEENVLAGLYGSLAHVRSDLFDKHKKRS